MLYPSFDNTWLLEFKSGNEKAFENLYQTYRDAIYLFAHKRLENSSEAEDVTAEAFVKLWKERTKFTNASHVRRYLYLAAKHACITKKTRDHRRRKTLLAVMPSAEGVLEEPMIDSIESELIGRIFREVEDLSPRQREVFLLTYVGEKSAEEIAAQLGIDVQTVYNTRSKAIEALKMKLSIDASLLLILLFPH